jgi:hypothetical protein
MAIAAKSKAANQQLGPCSIAYCKIYPTQVNCTSPIWLVCEKESISHLRISYAIYVPVSLYQRTPKKPHQKLVPFAPLLVVVVEADADATHGRRPVDVARSLVAGTMPTDGGRAELNLIDLQALYVCWIGTNDDASSTTNNVRAHC